MAKGKKGTGSKKMIEVSEEGLNKLLQTVETMNKERADLLARVERVESAADNSRLDAFDNKKRVIGPRKYKLSVYDGKVITGWRTLKDKEWKDQATGRMRHEQKYEILFSDLTKMEVEGYDNFATLRHEAQVTVEEVDRKMEGVKTTLTVKVVDANSDLNGEEYVVDLPFLN